MTEQWTELVIAEANDEGHLRVRINSILERDAAKRDVVLAHIRQWLNTWALAGDDEDPTPPPAVH